MREWWKTSPPRRVKGREKDEDERDRGTIPLSWRKKAIVPPILSREDPRRGKSAYGEREAPFSGLSLSFAIDVSSRISTISTAERSTASSPSSKGPCILHSRETRRCYVREERNNEAREGQGDKARGGCTRKKRERERERERGTVERHRAMCTTAERCSAAMCQCVSRWRPTEVDGLAFERHRRRSAVLGTRSVMESLAAPSVEAMTPSTPLLPPNARRFPSAPSSGSPYQERSDPTTDPSAATIPPVDPYPVRSPPRPRRHPRTPQEREERERERWWTRAMPPVPTSRAKLGACMQCTLPREMRGLLLEFFSRTATDHAAIAIFGL